MKGLPVFQTISSWISAMPAPFNFITGYAMSFNALVLLAQFGTWCAVELRQSDFILGTYELRKRWSVYEQWLPAFVGASVLMAFRRSGEGPSGRTLLLALATSQVPVLSSLLLISNLGLCILCGLRSLYYWVRPSARPRLDLYPDYDIAS